MDGGLTPPAELAPEPPVQPRLYDRLLSRIASPAAQRRLARLPLIGRIARAEGQALFDLVAGFVHSQVLLACVDSGLLEAVREGPRDTPTLAQCTGLSEDRLAVLVRAAIALRLVRRCRDGRVGLARRGAAVLGVPGLPAMIRHHPAFYRDLEDPMALLRGGGETELAQFWPYVLGATGAAAPETVARYSALMADSQALVAEDTLDQAPLADVRRLLDVGGGSGAFLAAALTRHRHLQAGLFDLPAVVATAPSRLREAGVAHAVTLYAGSFREDPLPKGYDAISLIRVLYDHGEETVAALLSACRGALPPGGLLLISEPMSGGDRPERAGDVYYALYTLAMGTGRARSAAEIAAHLTKAGFTDIRCPRPKRAFVTRTVWARAPG